jgi:site-specific recombinase XerD
VSFLTPEEITRLFTPNDSLKIQELRDLAILECIYSTGLRISELTALDCASINLETREFSVRGK